MGVVEQCLGYWGGTIAAMAMAANSFNSDHQTMFALQEPYV